MIRVVLTLVACFSVSSSLELSLFDPEACVTAPASPITRVIEASVPQVFTSPGFNYTDPDVSAYPDNQICQWSIYIEDFTDTLMLGFFNFSLEDDIDCSFDNVSVWDGPDDTGTPISIFCGELGNMPNYFTASNGSLFVKFMSDGNGIVGKGFAGRAAPPMEDVACDGTGPQVFTQPQGIFMTKNYPINYDNGATCEYSFQAPAGQKVEMSFDSFDLAQNCNDDFLEAFDGSQIQFATFAAVYSGNMLPSSMTSATNGSYLRLTTNEQRSSSGFIGSYRFVSA